jgi:hypothetical protein
MDPADAWAVLYPDVNIATITPVGTPGVPHYVVLFLGEVFNPPADC